MAENRASSDEARELTRQGLMQTRSVAAKFKARSPVLDKAIVSPYRRARQTAFALQSEFEDLQFEIESKIEPGGDIYDVLDTIEKYGVQQLLMVSHNPLLSNLLAILVDGSLGMNRYVGNSILVCVNLDVVAPGCGEILYTLEP